MAAAVEMGEVDDIHSKEDSVTDGVVMNGDIAESDKAEAEIDTSAPDTVEEETASADTANEDEDSSQDSQETEEKMEVDDEEDLEQPADDRQSQSEEEEEPSSAKNTDDDEVMEVDSNQDTLNSADVDDDDDEVEEGEVVNARVETSVEDEENVVHDVDDNSDDEVQITNKDSDPLSAEQNEQETVVLNDSNNDDDVVIVENDSDKPNGTTTPEKKKQSSPKVIEINATPVKSATQAEKNAVTPRRSSRNLNKSKSYILDEEKDTPSEGSDVEEVLPQDPLAVSEVQTANEKPNVSNKKQRNASTIVVKDTKRLVEIASKSTPQTTNSGKKEPTLVIIDTNSILSGRGPVPIIPKSTITPTYPILPVALPAQGIYPANMRATITPIPMNNTSTKTTLPTVTVNPTPSAPILPSLTDDMFVVEAPSFIVPYVYEKPPIKDLKNYLTELGEEIKKLKEKLKNEKKGEDEESGDEEMEEEDKEKKKEEEKKGEDEAIDPNKRHTYFDSPIGKFFVDIGSGLVEEFVQTDLLRQQKRKRDREGGQNADTVKTITSLIKSLEYTKENNQPYKMSTKKCEYCSYKTESALAMAFHLETPHMKNFVYKCNFCPYEVRSPHDILFHMEAEHCVRGRLERAPAFHQCPNCPFEDNQKGKLSRHMVACARKFKPERNMDPPIDWEPPAKIPRAPRMKQQQSLSTTAAMYQAMAKSSQMQFMKMQQNLPQATAINRGRGRPSLGMLSKQVSVKTSDGVYKQAVPGGGSVLVPTNYQVSGNQLYQVVGGQDMGNRIGGPMGLIPAMSTTSTVTIQNSTNKQSKTVHQPSISITPLPRGTGAGGGGGGGGGGGTSSNNSPGIPPGAKPGDLNSKNSFVICEICDGYIKDLEQLRNHMQWIHKVKIHPKMIYNRPPLNCQKCQFRFFTDQGLERHLLGSHGLVTSSMQEAANKCKDSGRCPVCGRVYQWKLLNHVARDHNMTLKPAHLSYKCTVCTATFGMYKQFENHVYSAHSVVAKKSIEKKAANSPSKSESLLKPLKINDEITIIPQMPKSNGAGTSKEGSPSTSKGGTTKSKSVDKKEVPLTGSAIESGEIQIINLG